MTVPTDNGALEMQRAEAGQQPICGFWRRILALLIDSLLLGAVGYGLGHFCFEFLASLGRSGRLIGLAAELIYFGLFNSALAGGQTIGKRVTGIRVVDQAGRTLRPSASMCRAVVLSIPFTLNGTPLPAIGPQSVIEGLVALGIFGGMVSIVYLYLFNRRTRQSLHDLAVGSYVITARVDAPPHLPRIWSGHLAMAGALCVLVLAVVVVVVPRIAQEYPIDQLLSLQRRLETTTDIQIANVSLGKSWGNGRTTTYVAVSAVVFPRPSDLKAMASRIARDVLSNFPPAAERDLLLVQLTYGYDIGIARSSESARYQWSPKALADSQELAP